MAASKKKRHHLISRGYQRFFADGEQLKLIDKANGTWTSAGTADVFVADHFNSWLSDDGWDASLEDRWQEVESDILPKVRRLNQGYDGTDEREAAKTLAALHFARSEAFHEMHLKLGAETVRRQSSRSASDPKMVRLFTTEVGHPPADGEIEARVRANWSALTRDRRFFLDSMERAFKVAQDIFSRSNVQLLRTREPMGFVLGDSPIVAGDGNLMKLNIRDYIALGDATQMFMPLGTHLAFTLWGGETPLPPDQDLKRYEVQTCNLVMWRAASRFLVCHPNLDLAKALQGKRIVETPKRRTAGG